MKVQVKWSICKTYQLQDLDTQRLTTEIFLQCTDRGGP
jgi:hypothetical protein